MQHEQGYALGKMSLGPIVSAGQCLCFQGAVPLPQTGKQGTVVTAWGPVGSPVIIRQWQGSKALPKSSQEIQAVIQAQK